MSAPNRVAVLNKAMRLLGSSRQISAPTAADSDDTRDLMQIYDISRRAALVLHPFNFAVEIQKLEREADYAAYSRGAEAFRFALKGVDNYLSWLPWPREHHLYFAAEERNGFLYSDDAGPVMVRHIFDQAEEASWAPLFVETMAHTLAIEHCQGKTQLLGLRDRLVEDRKGVISEAKRVDGRATQDRPAGASVGTSRWAGARFRSNDSYGGR